MYYTVQVYDEYLVEYVDNLKNKLIEIKSHKKIGLDPLKKVLKNFFDCYLDPKTSEITIPNLQTAYDISKDKYERVFEYYSKQKEMYDSLLQKIEKLTDGSDRIEYEIPSDLLCLEDKDTDRKLVKSVIYIIPFVEINEN